MAQYCRYCSFLVTGNGIYCTELNKEISEKYAKRVNKCNSFNLNTIDAFGENEKATHRGSLNKKNITDN